MRVMVFLTTLLALDANGAPVLRATLQIESPKLLPGLAPDLRVTLTNPTDEEIVLTNKALLYVRRDQPAEAFWAFPGTTAAQALPECFAAHHLRVDAHQTVQVPLMPSPTGEDGWWEDPRLHVPGRYAITVVLNPQAIPATPSDRAPSTIGASPAIVTNEITVTVEEPRSEDAEVWARLVRDVAEEEKSVLAFALVEPDVATELAAKYPRSAYSPWLALRVNEPGEDSTGGTAAEVARFTRLRRSTHDETATAGARAAAKSELRAFAKNAKSLSVRCAAGKELERLEKN